MSSHLNTTLTELYSSPWIPPISSTRADGSPSSGTKSLYSSGVALFERAPLSSSPTCTHSSWSTEESLTSTRLQNPSRSKSGALSTAVAWPASTGCGDTASSGSASADCGDTASSGSATLSAASVAGPDAGAAADSPLAPASAGSVCPATAPESASDASDLPRDNAASAGSTAAVAEREARAASSKSAARPLLDSRVSIRIAVMRKATPQILGLNLLFYLD